MSIFTRILQKYTPTQKRHVWAVAFLYMAPVSTLGAQQSAEEIIEFIKKDVTTIRDASDKNQKVINKNELASKFSQEKINGDSMNLAAFINELKKEDVAITEAASILLIEQGQDEGTRQQLRSLIALKLVQAKNFNLDELTLDVLEELFDIDDDINVIIDILKENKNEILEKVISDLKSNKSSLKQLNNLLFRKKQAGIPELGLSYETINIPSEVFINNIEKIRICKKIVEKIVRKTDKGATFIKEAFDKIKAQKFNIGEEKKVWMFLYHVCMASELQNLTEELKSLTPDICVGIKDDKVKKEAFKAVDRILYCNDEVAERFNKEAFAALEKLDKNDAKGIENMWEVISLLDEKIQIKNLTKAGLLNYHKLDPLFKKNESAWLSGLYYGKNFIERYLRKHKNEAQKLANNSFTEENQKLPHFWELLNYLNHEYFNGENYKISSLVDYTEINIEDITLETAIEGAKKEAIALRNVLIQEAKKDVIQRLWKEALESDIEDSYKLLSFIQDNYTDNYTWKTKLNNAALTTKKVIQMWKIDKAKIVKKILKQDQETAKGIANELYNRKDLKGWEVLHWLICDKKIVKASDVNIESFNIETVLEKFPKNQNKDKSNVMIELLKSHPEKATKLVNDILNSEDELNQNKAELLHWLVIPSNENNQVAIVSSEEININTDYVFKICENLDKVNLRLKITYRMLDILKSIIKAKPVLGKEILQRAIAISSDKSSWPNENVDFDLLYLLMEHPKQLQLNIKEADIGNLDLTEIKKNLKDIKALIVIKKILSENEKANKDLHWEIFPPNDISMRDKPFNYKNVDWDKTKWKDIKDLEPLIGFIEIPANIVVKNLNDENFLPIFKKNFPNYNDELKESILKKALPNITVTDGEWNGTLSEANWDIVKLFVDKGVIEPESVIKEVLPGITSTHKQFKKDYNLSKVNWKKFNEKAFPELVKYKIAEFSIEDYQTIAKKVLPGLAFTNEGVQASKIDWEKVKGFTTINYLIEKEIIPEKILVKMPGSTQKKLAASVLLNPAQAGLLEKVKEQKSIYRRNAALWLGTFVLGCIIVFYALRKKGKRKSSRAKKTQNKRAIKKIDENKPQQKRRKEISKKPSPSHRKGAMPQRKKN